MHAKLVASLLAFVAVAAELTFAKNCIYTNSGITKDILVWDDNVEVWSASHYWNWHFDNLACFKDTWNVNNGGMTLAINDGTSSCQFVDTGGNHLGDKYLKDRGWRMMTYCQQNQGSCAVEGTVLKTGEQCSCVNRQLVGSACRQSGWFGLMGKC
ncbi:hypothetical protein DFJ73DRAFT_758173 [Zopfochytrium polystomum]|nr:hypothetical protein DFJ73DRAFT_758173 [Zopfochytrium polystomum]